MHRHAFTVTVSAALALGGFARAADEATPAPRKAPKLSDLFGDEVLARGKGVEVKQSLLDQAYITQRATTGTGGQNLPDDVRVRQEAQLLDRLIVTQLLTNRVTETDRTNAQVSVERFLTEFKKRLPEEVFWSQMRAMGLSKEQLDRRLTEESLADAVIRRELRSKVSITDAQVKEFYDAGTDLLVKMMQSELEKLVKDPAATPQQVVDFKQRIDDQRKSNLARLQQPEQVKVQHIFVSTRDRQAETLLPEEARAEKRRRMERLRERALAGEDFTKLVMEFSEDRGLKETRGEYTFAREAPFAEEFKAAAFSLPPGKISDVVTTSYGLHVIKLMEKIPAQKLGLEKVASDLKDFLAQQEVVKAMPDYFAKLRQDAGVEIISPKYRAARPEPERIPEAAKSKP